MLFIVLLLADLATYSKFPIGFHAKSVAELVRVVGYEKVFGKR